MKAPKVIALVPARGGSKGIPKKNIMDFCGKPLISWSIGQALGSKYIKDVYVTSDDNKILKVSERAGAKPIKRPAKLATDTSSTEDALLHAIAEIEGGPSGAADIVVFLQATSPLRTSADIDKAIRLFISEKADSLFSGAVLDDFCVWEYAKGRLKSMTFDHRNRGRRQDRKPYYLENGSIYIFKPAILKKHRNRLGGKIVFFGMPFWKSYEIDKAEDVGICGYFMKTGILKRK